MGTPQVKRFFAMICNQHNSELIKTVYETSFT